MGITIDSAFFLPENKNNTEHVEAAETCHQFTVSVSLDADVNNILVTLFQPKLNEASRRPLDQILEAQTFL